MFIYKLNSTTLMLNGTAKAKTGVKLIEPDMYMVPWYMVAHGVDKMMTPRSYWVGAQILRPLRPGAIRYQAFVDFLKSQGRFAPYLRALQSTGEWGGTDSALLTHSLPHSPLHALTHSSTQSLARSRALVLTEWSSNSLNLADRIFLARCVVFVQTTE